MDFLNSSAILLLQKTLDATALTQRVIANNVANINTPGFKKSVVSFTEELKKALHKNKLSMRTSDPRHLGGNKKLDEVQPKVQVENTTSMTLNGNNVDIDQEMVNLSANELLYDFAAQRISGKFSGLGYVITGGKK